MTNRLVIGLGSNLGNRQMQLQEALRGFCALTHSTVLASSTIHASKAMLHPDNPDPQPDYSNLVAILATSTGPERLLGMAKRMEARLGRDFSLPRWSARPIDIDLLEYGGLQYQSSRLSLPHPHILTRSFVVLPWLEIDPGATVWGKPLQYQPPQPGNYSAPNR